MTTILTPLGAGGTSHRTSNQGTRGQPGSETRKKISTSSPLRTAGPVNSPLFSSVYLTPFASVNVDGAAAMAGAATAGAATAGTAAVLTVGATAEAAVLTEEDKDPVDAVAATALVLGIVALPDLVTGFRLCGRADALSSVALSAFLLRPFAAGFSSGWKPVLIDDRLLLRRARGVVALD